MHVGCGWNSKLPHWYHCMSHWLCNFCQTERKFSFTYTFLGFFFNNESYFLIEIDTLDNPLTWLQQIRHIPECLTGQNSKNSLSSLLSMMGFSFKSEIQIILNLIFLALSLSVCHILQPAWLKLPYPSILTREKFHTFEFIRYIYFSYFDFPPL